MDSSHSDTERNGEPSEPLVLGSRMDTLHNNNNNNNNKGIKMRTKFRNRAFLFPHGEKADDRPGLVTRSQGRDAVVEERTPDDLARCPRWDPACVSPPVSVARFPDFSSTIDFLQKTTMESGLRSSLSSRLTMSPKRGLLERSCSQHCSISW
ncbi:hypothetical protein EYF80_040882 [Liparis tanakae]|uniref:Uncharacterized protein n=1 Tax=Liparis tanakae TaxID=230148 RepID=A0A4Z2G5Z7_9TELE|nr:hypothetical protein EYF80_040882 [Liparis tanakae]